MLNMGAPLSLSLSFVWLLLSFANCSHFRGGSISWKPTSNPSQIEISHQMAWRRSYSSSSYCDDTKKANGGLIALSANLYCREGCNSTSSISTMRGKCIAFSAGEDWSLGEGSFLFTVPTPGIQYTFRLEGCCWQSLSNGASSGSMRMTLTADLQPRSDTGVINSSPVVTMTPVVRLLAGCQHSLRIPVIDADGDIVRCRFPTSNSTNECGKLCDGLAGSTIDTDTCVFNYNSTSGTGTYGVSVQIEDFAVTAPTAVLSSVPVQFLIIVFYDSLSCDDAPSFVDPTPPEASCHVVTSTFTKTIVARTKNAAHSVTKIFLMGPTGITKTSLAPYGSSGREWSISVTWSPTSNQAGYHLVCFNAEINSKLSSSMICIDLMKGTPPSIKQNCLTPSSDVVMGPNITFKMCFDRKIMRPTTDKFMIIYHSNGTEANRLNITDPNIAIFSTSVDRTVTVTWGGSSGPDILGVGQYYILLEAGSVAAPPLSCLADWPGITQPFYWNFTVVDRTPPTLSFTSNPTQANDNETFFMTWTVSEPLSVERCNLTTPSSSSIVNCRGTFTQNNLVAGNYSISIEIEDLNGNKAGPFDHQWVVIDRTPPTLSFTSNPTHVNDNETFSMTWTVSEPLSVERCNLTTPSSSSIVNCRGSFTQNNLVAGNYSISIEIEDLNGNKAGPFDHQWVVIDRTPPTLSFTSNPTHVNDNETFSMTWTVSEPLSVERCNLTTPSSSSIVNCRGSFTQNNLVAGNYSISTEIEDLNGNKAGPFDHQWVVIDRTPPTLRFTSNPTHVNDNETFSMTWTVSEPLSVERCNLTTPSSSSIVNCRGSFTQNNLVAGNYSISIEIEDLYGNKAGPFDHQWVVTDVTPPSLTFVNNPSLTKSNASITWTLSEPVASSKCTVTFPNGTVVNETCNDQWEAIDLPRGTYQISIVLVDAAGNIGGAFRHTWTNIDVTPPILTFRRKPRRSLSKANITWVTNEEADGVCEVQGPSSFYRSVVCDKAWSEDYLPEGNFILNVTVYDRSLNMAGPFQHIWYNRDVKPPELKLTSTPYCDKSYDNASLTWTFNEDATSTCLIRTSLKTEFAVCDKSWSGTFLPEGNVTIEVNARDKSRNSAPSYSYTWYNKDITPPVLTFTRNGALTINDATITWSVNEPASANCTLTTPFTTSVFSCDSGSWSGSSLQGGIYELSIRLLDLGNNSAGPYVHKWRNVDTVRPKMTFTKTPSRTYSNATIQWGVSESVNGSCEIRGPSNFYRNVSCDRSWVGLNLPPGSFTLLIMVIDTSGNLGGPSSHTWINEDVTPPSLQWVGLTPSQTNGSIMLSWTTDEAVTSLCTVHSPVKATDVSCNNKWVGTELRHGEYSLTVKMVDGSGNKAEAVHRWNNTALELVFEVILTLSNVKVTDFTNKTSPEYSKLETESQTGLENFYQQKVDNFKAVHIRDINVFSKPTRQKRSTTSTGSQVIVDHDVVLGGNNMSTGAAALSKTLSTLSTGGSTINIGGSTATFANVTLLLDKRASNVTFSKDSSTCEISQLYVKCGLREYCDEATGMCVTNAKPDNNGMILSIGLGVSGLVVLLLTTIIVVLFYLRKKAEQHKKRQQIENDEKKRFEKPVETITFPPQVMYKPYKYWQ